MKVPCPSCRINVHGKCLVEWLLTKPTCPVCRTNILEYAPPVNAQDALLLDIMNNPAQLIWTACAALVSIGIPWLFFLTDIVLGLAGFTYLYTDQDITPALSSCMVGSIFAHLITGFFTIPDLINPQPPNATRHQGSHINTFGSLLAMPLAATLCILSIMCCTIYDPTIEPKPSIGILESTLYMGMSYILMFVVTVSAMVRFNISSWKINLICMRIAFVFIMSNASSIADTKALVVSCSLVATVLSAMSSKRFLV